MAGLTPEMSAQLQEYVNAQRAPRSGTWASPDTAPLPAATPVVAPLPEPVAAPIAQEAVPVGPAPVVVPPQSDIVQPWDAPGAVAPMPEPAPAVAPAPPVDLPAASQVAVQPTNVVEAEPLPAPPRNMEEAQARSSQATSQAANALRAEGEARAKGMAADATLFDQQVSEQKQAEADGKRERDERENDYNEAVNQLKLAQAQNERLNQITDRRTTTQKVLGVIAQVGSAVADGFARMGGNNHTDYAGQMYKQLNDQIERDVQRQKEAIEGRNKDVAMKLTGVGLAKTALGNTEDAILFESRQKGVRYANELKAQAARTGSDVARQEMLSAAAKLEADAAQKDLALQERLVEQKMRSRVGSGSGSGGGGALDLATIRTIVENNGTLSKDQMKAAISMGLFKKDADGVNLDELQGKVDRKETLSPAEARLASSAGMFKKNEDKADTADQAKARLLFKSSSRPAAALEARMAANDFPATSQSVAEKLGIAPDEWNKKAALFAQEVESVGNDLLRYESGASISTQETEGLIKRTRSTDPEIRNAAVQRLLDKREALGGAFKHREEQSPRGSVQADDSVQRQTKSEKTAPEGSTRVQILVNGQPKTYVFGPTQQAEANQLLKYPGAKRL